MITIVTTFKVTANIKCYATVVILKPISQGGFSTGADPVYASYRNCRCMCPTELKLILKPIRTYRYYTKFNF